jgi:type I restriction enzyme, S subunit
MSKVKIIPDLRFPEFENEGEWTFEELEQCLDYLQPTPYLVESTDYKDEYEIPVLTAGKTFILGYTNEKEGVFRENLPVIIFDDFTTASQFVDFPFKAKSSAMKILLAKNDNNIKFVYEAIKNFNYEVGVHQRHWISIFSKLRIAIPKNPQEQQKIASCLSSLDEMISAHSQKLDLLKDHKKGLMQNLFPQEGEKVPKYRFKEFEKDGEWELKPFSKYIKLYRGSSPRPIIEYQTQGVDGVNWIKIGDTGSVTDFVIRSVSEKITPKGTEKSRAVKKGELILANSMSYGSTYLLDIEGCIYDGWFVLREYDEVFDKQFLLQLLNSEFMQNQYKKLAAGGIVQNISSEIVYSTLLPKTSKTEQQKIASCLSSLDALITAQAEKIEQLKLHKKGLMQGLFPKINE